MDDHIISKEGHEKLEEELNHLTVDKRREIAERIEKAKDMGDLSENAEYAEAKEAQAFNEGRIAEIKNLLKNLTIVENGNAKNKVSMGSKVTIKMGAKTKTYSIVSFNEVDPLQGKISNESPLGMAFLDKKKGDKGIVSTPKGEIKYEIIKIE